MDTRESLRLAVLRQSGLRELRWISLVIFWLLLAFAIIDGLTHADDGSARWRLLTSLVPSAVAGIVYLLVRADRVPPHRAGVILGLPVITLQASILCTVWFSRLQADIGYMVVLATLLGSVAISCREYVALQIVCTSMTVMAIALVRQSMLDSESLQSWLMVLGVAIAAATNLQWARRHGLRHLADRQSDLEAEANRDPLTGLTSRRGLDRSFPALRDQAARISAPMFALFVDVDGLKSVNDEAGHDVGDTVIDAVAVALRQHCRRNDLVCRWGGDEFVVVGVGDGPDPARLELILADHLQVVNPAPQVWSGRVSVGRTISPPTAVELLALLGAADDDMYARREERRAHQQPSPQGH